jgi:DNA-binding MarR family transcriptional regulator
MSTKPLRHVLELLPNAFHRVGTAGDILHAPIGLGSGMRGLLLSLEYAGPTSVSKLAAMRPVSRQFVQRLVDELLVGGWVEAIANPQHKRSPLIRLTVKGSGAIAAMQAAEEPYLIALGEGLDPDDLSAAARILSAIAERIGPDALEQLADGVDPVLALETSNG